MKLLEIKIQIFTILQACKALMTMRINYSSSFLDATLQLWPLPLS